MNVLRKIGCFFASIASEFIEGLIPEYILSGIAGTLFLFYCEINGGLKEIGPGFLLVVIIDAVLMAVALRITLRNNGHENKIIAIIDHVLTFFIIGFIGKVVLIILIGIALICGALIFFKGMDAFSNFFGSSESTTFDSEPEPIKKKVEVWRKNGIFTENLKVNSSGDMYYDPDDGEWHKIQK